ncbi:MAG: PadR family transcriptional regulator [Rhodopirellula sp.]|nr:PadR family transcriptional regulator [Rhodopirellula sp.]
MPKQGTQISLDLLDCPCAGSTLDKLIQPAILTLLAAGSMHGYGLAERLSEMPLLKGSKPDPSGVYRFLRTMEEKGLVVSSWDTSHAGPARKTYQITSAGQACLRSWIETLERYRKGIDSLLRAARHASGE